MLKVIAVIFGVVLSLGCSKEDEENRTKIKFSFDLNVDGDPLEFAKEYNINGTLISFEVANFYVGGIVVYFDIGDSINLSSQYLLGGMGKTANLENNYMIRTIDSAKFFVGVDPIINMQTETDFTRRPSSDPLSIKDPSMHWNWDTGYKFVGIDGEVDSNGDGALDTPVSYHLASDSMLTKFHLNTSISLQQGTSTLNFDFDLARFFSGVDLSKELDTHTSNNLPLAIRLQDNLRNALTHR